MRIVEVAAQDLGWMMLGCGEALFFRSGRAAENAGRRLAAALSASQVIELRIFDRGGRLAGQLRYAGGAGVFEPFVDWSRRSGPEPTHHKVPCRACQPT